MLTRKTHAHTDKYMRTHTVKQTGLRKVLYTNTTRPGLAAEASSPEACTESEAAKGSATRGAGTCFRRGGRQ